MGNSNPSDTEADFNNLEFPKSFHQQKTNILMKRKGSGATTVSIFEVWDNNSSQICQQHRFWTQMQIRQAEQVQLNAFIDKQELKGLQGVKVKIHSPKYAQSPKTQRRPQDKREDNGTWVRTGDDRGKNADLNTQGRED